MLSEHKRNSRTAKEIPLKIEEQFHFMMLQVVLYIFTDVPSVTVTRLELQLHILFRDEVRDLSHEALKACG